jgi:hypothetical protein
MGKTLRILLVSELFSWRGGRGVWRNGKEDEAEDYGYN